MRHHRAFGQTMETLDVVVVDDAKPMQTILRSILLACRVARVRCFDTAAGAFESMMVEPPNLLVVDWHMKPTSGLALVASIRNARLGRLATVPTILLTAHPTRKIVENAVKLGIHAVIAKPLAPATLVKRIGAILFDQRQFVFDERHQIYRLEGAEAVLAAQRLRYKEIYDVEPVLQSRTGPKRPDDPPEQDDAKSEIAAARTESDDPAKAADDPAKAADDPPKVADGLAESPDTPSAPAGSPRKRGFGAPSRPPRRLHRAIA